jgi:MFS transporter, FSR family, fosmidomycin resistance protein
MARTAGGDTRAATAPAGARDKVAAGGVIGAHTLQHTYQHGFYVIVPELYTALGMTPVAAGALEMVRRVSGGVASLGGGFLLDRFQNKRILVLYLSLVAMGLGYLLVGVVPVYVVILAAAGLATAAGSIWHPAALSLLSQRYPARRGLMIALHRSAGSVGDFLGPLLVGGLLVVLMWQGVLYGALPVALLFALVLWLVLRRAPGWEGAPAAVVDHGSVGQQLRAVGALLTDRSLAMLLAVAGLSGLGQGGLLLWLGLYLQETQGMGSVGIGAHIALLTGFGVVMGPLFGLLSDRVGRKPVIIGVLAAKTAIATLMALAGGGIALTVLVALMGTVMFGVNSLVQAGALDVAEGRGLEASTIGLLWGINSLFVGASPLIVGFLIEGIGFGVLFWYVATMNAVALGAALALPSLTGARR